MGTIPCLKKKKKDILRIGHKQQLSDKSIRLENQNYVEQIVEDQVEEEEQNIVYDYIQGDLIQEGCKVYCALNTLNGQLLALKIFKLSNQDDFNTIINFVDVLTRLECNNIHKIIGWDYSIENNEIIQDEIRILMPYESGGSISWLLYKFNSFSTQLAIMFMKQILQGLESLHNSGILHRNLKTSNVLVDGDANAKLSDIYVLKDFKLSFYSAPECFTNYNYCEQSDVWSAGCIFIEMLTRKSPWNHLSQNITLHQIKMCFDKGELFPYSQITNNLDILQIFNDIFKINPRERLKPSELLDHSVFRNLETEPLKSVIVSTRRQLQNRYDDRKSYKIQNSNVSNSSLRYSIRRSHHPDSSKYQQVLQQLKSIHVDFKNVNNLMDNQQLSYIDIQNVLSTKIQLETKIKEKGIQQVNKEIIGNRQFRPKEISSLNRYIQPNQYSFTKQHQQRILSLHKSLNSSLDKIQTIRSVDPAIIINGQKKQVQEIENLEKIIIQQFYQKQINENHSKNNLNDIEKMMIQQFQSSLFKQSSIVEQNIQNSIQQPIEANSEILDQQTPNYLEKLMQDQFNQDNESGIDELQQLEDLIKQQFYKDYNKKSVINNLEQKMEQQMIQENISIVAFDQIIQSPKINSDLIIDDDFLVNL
ncbi:unnamed protein product [Paramecium sonneborni]|uniref:Protein kinase domain-containing protein n=1 Tax=Paramecium sonneborni TaxID=65129 RepID=A0A8S1QC09_9CILI|nr:unnamed protein product [Paramecium sonneborni]